MMLSACSFVIIIAVENNGCQGGKIMKVTSVGNCTESAWWKEWGDRTVIV
jgi:hypothetical protein